jgi:MFS transporter, FSR family, fosmidomycin resistance protein
LLALRRRSISPGWHLGAQSGMHVVNDGLFVGIYPLLPLVAAELSLSYAQVGLLKTAYSGASAVLQVPAGMLAERWGEQMLLALGTGWVALGLCLIGLSGSFVVLVGLALAAGLGGNVQHPVATSVISRLFEGGRRSTAIGTLNFAGDVGKIIAPLVAGAAALAYGWRGGFVALGAIGLAFALVYLALVPEPDRPPPARVAADGTSGGAPEAVGWGIARPTLFAALTAVGMLDAMARGTALTFLPFLLESKGIDPAGTSFYFSVLFAAGAAGKFLCGPLGDRWGNVAAIVVTELITAGGLVVLLAAPAELVLLALLPLGFVLNGTSSVLYAAVAGLVDVRRRARGYGLFYTCTLCASAGAPILYGLLADLAGLSAVFLVLALATGLIAPVALAMRRGLGAQPA